MPTLDAALSTVVERCLGVKPGEQVLVIGDPASRPLAEALREEAARAGAEAVVATMDERPNHGSEPPPTIAAALLVCDVYLAPTTKSLSHTAARKAATDAGIRGATLPGVTEDMLARVMSVDLAAMQERSRALGALLTKGAEAHVTCPLGTDLRLDLTGRDGLSDDGDLTAPGAFGNLPAGEGFISPVGASGPAVFSSVGGIGLADEPMTLTMRDGRLVEGDGTPTARAFMHLLAPHGDAGANVAELGIGTNDAAILTGNMLEDEKILGTVHVAFGASAGIGGTVSVPIHLDCVVLDASIAIDGTPVVEGGRWVL